MKKLNFLVYPAVVAFSLAAAASAHAAPAFGYEGDMPQPAFVSQKTRAQVLVELQQARADGSLARQTQESYNPVVTTASNRSRAEVSAQARSARIVSWEAQYREGADIVMSAQPQALPAGRALATAPVKPAQ